MHKFCACYNELLLSLAKLVYNFVTYFSSQTKKDCLTEVGIVIFRPNKIIKNCYRKCSALFFIAVLLASSFSVLLSSSSKSLFSKLFLSNITHVLLIIRTCPSCLGVIRRFSSTSLSPQMENK